MMIGRWSFSVFLVAMLAACAGPVTHTHDPTRIQKNTEEAIQRHYAAGGLRQLGRAARPNKENPEDRLRRVGARLLLAAAPYCDETTHEFFYSVTARTGDYPTIAPLADDLPAMADIEPDDIVIAIDGEAIRPDYTGYTQLVDDMGQSAQHGLPLTLTVRRMGMEMERTITPQLRCDYNIVYKSGSTLNAYADGNTVYFYRGLIRKLHTDDELAALVGHELAHNIMDHADKQEVNTALGGVAGVAISVLTLGSINPISEGIETGGMAYTQGFEQEADYVGAYIMAAAGYDVDANVILARRLGQFFPDNIKEKTFLWETHPSSRERGAALVRTVTEIKNKQTRGEALIPNLKPRDEKL